MKQINYYTGSQKPELMYQRAYGTGSLVIESEYYNNAKLSPSELIKEFFGYPIQTAYSLAGDLINWKLYGNSVQRLLPEGYTQLEYIESTGTQYIDTGVPQAKDIDIDIDFALTTTSQANFTGIVAGTTTSSLYCVYFGIHSTNGLYSQIGSSQEYSYLDIPLDIVRHKAKYRFANDTVTVSLDSKVVSYTSTTALASGNILIGTRASSTTILKARYYSAKIGNVRNLVPAKRDSDNEIGMYDLCGSICPLTGTPFYINAGN